MLEQQTGTKPTELKTDTSGISDMVFGLFWLLSYRFSPRRADEDYRRGILTRLNRGEDRHSVVRTICYGRRGEIRKRYREGQGDRLGASGLVQAALDQPGCTEFMY